MVMIIMTKRKLYSQNPNWVTSKFSLDYNDARGDAQW